MDAKPATASVREAMLPYNGSTTKVMIVNGPGAYSAEDQIIIVTSGYGDNTATIKGKRNLIFSNGNHIASLWSVVVGDNNAFWDSYPDSFCGYIFTSTEVEYSVTRRTRVHVCKRFDEVDTYFQHIDQPERGLITIARALYKDAMKIISDSANEKKLAQERAENERVKTDRLNAKFSFPDFTYVPIVDKPNQSVIAHDKKVTAARVFICGDRSTIEGAEDCVVIGNGCEGKRCRGCIFIGKGNFDEALGQDPDDMHPKSTDNDFFDSLQDMENCRNDISKNNNIIANADLEKLNLACRFAEAVKAYAKQNSLKVSDALYAVAIKKSQPPKPSVAAVPVSFQMPMGIQSGDPVALVANMYPSFMEQFRSEVDAINSDPILKKRLDNYRAGWEVQYNQNVKTFNEGLNDLREDIADRLKKLRGGR